jgi:hypothetical protein
MRGARKPFSYDEPMLTSDFAARADAELSTKELAEMVELIRWFRRRYPTVEARFAYASRKTRELRNGPRAKIR